MVDKQVSSTVVYAAVLWIVGIALTIVNVWISLDVGPLGLTLVAAGATLTIRRYFCGLVSRERRAFELGRDYQMHEELGTFE